MKYSNCDLVSHIFGKNFVKVTLLLNKLHSVEKYTKMRSRFLRKNLNFFRQIEALL